MRSLSKEDSTLLVQGLEYAWALQHPKHPDAAYRKVNSGVGGNVPYPDLYPHLAQMLSIGYFYSDKDGSLKNASRVTVREYLKEVLPKGYRDLEQWGRPLNRIALNHIRNLPAPNAGYSFPEFSGPGGIGRTKRLVVWNGVKEVPTHSGYLVWAYWMVRPTS